MGSWLVERRLRQNSDRLRRLREELRIIDEQLAHLADDADDKGIRSLVAETPFAASKKGCVVRHGLNSCGSGKPCIECGEDALDMFGGDDQRR